MTTGGWAPAPEPWISYVADSDGDGLDDYQERVLFGSDPSRADTDGDGLNDADEADRHQDPTDSDSDDDGVPDGQDSWSAPKDRDGDGLTGEVSAGLSEIDPDSDDDGLNDGDEWLSTHFPTEEGATSSPTDPDSDDDGFLDGAERDNGTDPSTPDFPGDLRTEIPDDIGPFVDTPDPGALPLPEPDDPALLFGAGSTPPNGSAAEANGRLRWEVARRGCQRQRGRRGGRARRAGRRRGRRIALRGTYRTGRRAGRTGVQRGCRCGRRGRRGRRGRAGDVAARRGGLRGRLVP